MTVSRLYPDPRVPGYLIVEAGGGRFASLPVEVVQELGLKEGGHLDAGTVELLRARAEVDGAWRVATSLLAARARSAGELERKLRERAHHPEAIRAALDRLRASGALDDGAFSRQFAASRLGKGHGASRVLSDLLARGVERRVAERAVKEASRDEGIRSADQVERLIQRRAAVGRSLPVAVRRRRLLSYLARRGFQGGRVRVLVERAVSQV
ncbi:MAG TPA: regulatory protein RecX [Gemmatimonadales bacterium]|nr:regulatory protein RecX [Gemmatimonadales bacterium]